MEGWPLCFHTDWNNYWIEDELRHNCDQMTVITSAVCANNTSNSDNLHDMEWTQSFVASLRVSHQMSSGCVTATTSSVYRRLLLPRLNDSASVCDMRIMCRDRTYTVNRSIATWARFNTTTTLCSEKNTHSHLLSYLHELFVDSNKNCSEYTQGLVNSNDVKIRYSLRSMT